MRMKKPTAYYKPRSRISSTPEELLETANTLRKLIDRYRPGTASRVKIHFTNNSCTMVSRSETGETTHLRLHHLFSRAPAPLLRDLVRFCFLRVSRNTSRRVRAALMDFVEEYREETLHPVPPDQRLPPRGQTYDLVVIASRVRARYLPELRTMPDVGWTRQAHRSLMGKWIPTPATHPNLVLINRLLDTAEAPLYYVEFVVFHELLHEFIPTGRSCGRWNHHPPEFKNLERRFPLHAAAHQWELDHLDRLYRLYRQRLRTSG